jgi:hypothetical protein
VDAASNVEDVTDAAIGRKETVYMSRSKKSGNKKTEMTLARNPEADDVAALFEQLTGRKPTAAEMLEVEQTLDDEPIAPANAND